MDSSRRFVYLRAIFEHHPDQRGLAFRRSPVEALKILLKAGADVNRRAAKGQTAMHAAVLQGWNATIQYLAENGAALGTKFRDGKTPLDFAKWQLQTRVRGRRQRTPVLVSGNGEATQELIAKSAASRPWLTM